jgi:hypothetical protein
MDSSYNIYSAAEGQIIPPEDLARLDGYLKGREEADVKAEVERLRQAVRDMDSQRTP